MGDEEEREDHPLVILLVVGALVAGAYWWFTQRNATDDPRELGGDRSQASDANVSWQRITSNVCGFAALLPGTPEYGGTTTEGGHFHHYVAKVHGVIVEATCAEPAPLAKRASDALRREAVNHATQNLGVEVGGQIDRRRDITIDGAPGVEADVLWRAGDLELVTRWRIVLSRTRYYQFGVTVLGIDRDTSPAFNRVFNSVSLSEPGFGLAPSTPANRLPAQPRPAPSPIPRHAWCAENGSCFGDLSNITGRPKTTHVRGYYRDGKYVRGHFRGQRR